uniref:Putative GIY-YIG homing endonuclease n=1 Tax=Pediastrum duplex TaxID=3105 RepID=A0A2U8GIB9_PEDDU|nr:putative GIY-YIG homing endonuclease [Pediastrum duplex]
MALSLFNSSLLCSASKADSSVSDSSSLTSSAKPKESMQSKGKTEPIGEPISEPEEPIDVSLLNYPGIYEILDIKNNFSYYRESKLLIQRFARHYEGLMDESHESKALIEAFKQQNKQIENFRFLVLKSGPEWADRKVRLEYENKLVQANKHRCYNVKGVSDDSSVLSQSKAKSPTEMKARYSKTKNIRNPLSYNGKVYSSARAAAAGENIARSTVLRHVNSIKHPNVFYLQKEVYGQIPIFAKSEKGLSVLFNSMGECVKANYATSVQYAYRQIKRKVK